MSAACTDVTRERLLAEAEAVYRDGDAHALHRWLRHPQRDCDPQACDAPMMDHRVRAYLWFSIERPAPQSP